jgi:hypothetical protein
MVVEAALVEAEVVEAEVVEAAKTTAHCCYVPVYLAIYWAYRRRFVGGNGSARGPC